MTYEDIADVVARSTGIPVQRLLAGERQKLLQLHERLAERVIGQPEPVAAVAAAIRRARAGMQAPGRPVGSFLLLGPTGVGKTWLACALAHKACREGYTVQYLRLTRLLRDLMIAKGDGRYPKLLANLAKVDVLLLDDCKRR